MINLINNILLLSDTYISFSVASSGDDEIGELVRKLKKYILKGKRNAYFEFLNDGFILKTLFFLISAIYTN